MLLYWLFALLIVVPLAGVAALLNRVVRPGVSLPALTLWSALCVADGLFWSGMYHAHHRTAYAPGYREAGFQQVAPGMSEAQVRALVGEPLGQWRPYQWTTHAAKRHYVGYEYSRSAGGQGDYELRQINFDRGRVAEVVRYRYYD